ncbi:hypothetical protein GGX14DRAFT_575755 [Mycena pura]|uniref:Uncharacterized protein n=1 Tax=Mycena pura TaxID=153505 RepID=A0AAD6Y0G4_9AGAR|nr:hypothetical protein GGX14DRAFT_575755 [Mycena pura]
MNLRDQDATALDRFVQANTTDERLTLLYATLLVAGSDVRKVKIAEHITVSADMKWPKMTLTKLFKGRAPPPRPTRAEIEEQAERDAQNHAADAEEDDVPDDGAVEIPSEEEYPLIKMYAQAYLLNPSTVAFRGLNDAEHILAAMREYHPSTVPSIDDLIAVKAVIAEIGKQLMYWRNIIKTKILHSLQRDSSTRNIAELTNAIISNSKIIQPALQLYLHE